MSRDFYAIHDSSDALQNEFGARRIFTTDEALKLNREGWGIFDSDERGEEIQRIDCQDDPDGVQLDTDDQAIALARAAGVPVDETGQFLPHITEIRWEQEGTPLSPRRRASR